SRPPLRPAAHAALVLRLVLGIRLAGRLPQPSTFDAEAAHTWLLTRSFRRWLILHSPPFPFPCILIARLDRLKGHEFDRRNRDGLRRPDHGRLPLRAWSPGQRGRHRRGEDRRAPGRQGHNL